ncbi:MAG: hypothetical protein R3F43_11995 [bacterium]
MVWHLDITVDRHDSDMGLNEVEYWTVNTTLLCSTGPAARAASAPSARVKASESLGID